MSIFSWEKNFETGLPQVDEQHRGLLDRINQCGALLQRKKPDLRLLDQLFHELYLHTEQHFLAEENLMESFSIDPRHRDAHIREHADFLQEIDFMQRDLGLGDVDAERALLQFHNNWLAYHLLGSDKSMSRQIAAIESGLSATDAYQREEFESNRSTQALLHALNDLFKQASTRNRQLVEMNRTLEAKVAKRTLALSEANRNLEELALTDMLTGLPNRRHAMRRLAQLWEEAVDEKAPLSCMMIDADNFKHINDQFGHDAGDAVLCQLARRLSEAIRSDDVVCRLGGDEFLVICPATPLDGAMHLAEIVRTAVAELKVPTGSGTWHGSVSIGVATRTATMAAPDDLIKVADEGVYAAKRAGRNCSRTTSLPDIAEMAQFAPVQRVKKPDRIQRQQDRNRRRQRKGKEDKLQK